MYDAFAVRGIERVGDLDPEVENFVDRQWPLRHELKQCLALQKLHREERMSLYLADVMQRADIGMIQRRGSAAFPLKAL